MQNRGMTRGNSNSLYFVILVRIESRKTFLVKSLRREMLREGDDLEVINSYIMRACMRKYIIFPKCPEDRKSVSVCSSRASGKPLRKK